MLPRGTACPARASGCSSALRVARGSDQPVNHSAVMPGRSRPCVLNRLLPSKRGHIQCTSSPLSRRHGRAAAARAGVRGVLVSGGARHTGSGELPLRPGAHAAFRGFAAHRYLLYVLASPPPGFVRTAAIGLFYFPLHTLRITKELRNFLFNEWGPRHSICRKEITNIFLPTPRPPFIGVSFNHIHRTPGVTSRLFMLNYRARPGEGTVADGYFT